MISLERETEIIEKLAAEETLDGNIIYSLMSNLIAQTLGSDGTGFYDLFQCGHSYRSQWFTNWFLSLPGIVETCNEWFDEILRPEIRDTIRLKVAKELKTRYSKLWSRPITWSDIDSFEHRNSYQAILTRVVNELVTKLAEDEAKKIFEEFDNQRRKLESKNKKETGSAPKGKRAGKAKSSPKV